MEGLDEMLSSNKSDNLSVSSQYQYQRFHTHTNLADLTKLEKAISDKLSYEWKNIYRSLVASDTSQTGQVSSNRFNQICLQYNTMLNKEDIQKLTDLFGEAQN